MGLGSSMFGSSKTPSYLKALNKAGAQFQQDQMKANKENWNDALNYSMLGPKSDIGYGTAAGNWLNSNPYIDEVVNNTTQQIADNYNKSYIPQALSSFASSGRYGSGLFQKTLADTQSQMNKDVGNAANQAYYNNYNTERGYQENALSRLGQQYDPLNRNATYSNILNAGNNQVNTNYQDTKSGFGAELGAIAQLAATAGPLLALSDERLKENKKKVGKLDNGFDVYKYNFKGEKTPRIGLMAQDVKKKKPEAVGDVGGWLGVNYDLATEE